MNVFTIFLWVGLTLFLLTVLAGLGIFAWKTIVLIWKVQPEERTVTRKWFEDTALNMSEQTLESMRARWLPELLGKFGVKVKD